MSDELLPPCPDLLAPRADFSGTRPLVWSASRTVGADLDMCRMLVQPGLYLRLDFRPDAKEGIHVLQRGLALHLESAGLFGGYANDELYLVLGLLRQMRELDGERVVNLLTEQPVIARVHYSDVQPLARALADVAAGEVGKQQPVASALLFSLIRQMAPQWQTARWALRQRPQLLHRSPTPGNDEGASS